MSGRAAPRHDRDAGGDADLLAAKAELRRRTWAALDDGGAARFPGAPGRIPNFVGAEAAAERLRTTPVWQRAAVVKANPDSPQWPVRQRALEDGKTVFMAVPRLAGSRPFLRLDPDRLTVPPRKASSIRGCARWGQPVDLFELEPVDLVVVGCVAAGEDGTRLGKGGGFADLEVALAGQAGLVGPSTLVATTVHDLQVVPAGEIPVTGHDVGLDLIVTPTRLLEVRAGRGRGVPRLNWDELTEAKIRSIPALRRLRAGEA